MGTMSNPQPFGPGPERDEIIADRANTDSPAGQTALVTLTPSWP
jgi:hypothetical protein